MGEQWNLSRLEQEWVNRGLNRRDLMKLIGAGAGTTALMTFLGAAPGGVSAQDGETQASVLWRAPNTLNPLYSSSGSEQQVERAMFGALVKMSDALIPTPDLAETVEVSEDATTYTFTLRDGLTFNDGTPMTSADAIFTLERAINPATGSIWQGRLSGVLGAADYDGSGEVEGLAAPDEKTVVITLAAPNGAFLVDLCSFSGLGILPKHILGEIPPDQLQENAFSLEPTTTGGSYDFVQFATDQFLEMQKSATYPGEVGIDRVFHAGAGRLVHGHIRLVG